MATSKYIARTKSAPVFHLLLLLMCSFVSLHCEHVGPLEALDETEKEEGAVPTLSDIQRQVFTSSCAISGCHLGSGAIMGLNLAEGATYGSLVGVKSTEVSTLALVKPGDPDNSYLIEKLIGGNRMAAGTLKMPLGREALTDAQIDLVRDWITDGAKDN